MRRASFCLTLALAWPSLGLAQGLRVAVESTDSTGIITSIVRSTLRQLGDVTVVEPPEASDYIISLIVACHPNCANVTEYAVAIDLRSRLTVGDVFFALTDASIFSPDAAALRPLLTVLDAQTAANDFSTRVGRSLQHFYQIHHAFAALWGRSRVEQSVQALIRQWDAKCFEKHRLIARSNTAMMAGRHDEASTIRRAWLDPARGWVC